MAAKYNTVTSELWRFAGRHRPSIEKSLQETLPLAPAFIETRFNEAVRYAVFPGGKRLRPVLTILGTELFGGRADGVLHAAAAVEFIHTSSIIFDDLPSMDNSPNRRGQSSLHAKFGEDLSILVAVGLLNSSYRLVTSDRNNNPGRSLDAVLEIVDCVGPAGMVGGQAVDRMLSGTLECRTCAVDKFGQIQNLKTSSLIRLALRLGAIMAGARNSDLENLTRFAECLGQAYQISDDIIDTNQDASLNGNGFAPPSSDGLLHAVAQAKTMLTSSFDECDARECLSQLVDYVAERRS